MGRLETVTDPITDSLFCLCLLCIFLLLACVFIVKMNLNSMCRQSQIPPTPHHPTLFFIACFLPLSSVLWIILLHCVSDDNRHWGRISHGDWSMDRQSILDRQWPPLLLLSLMNTIILITISKWVSIFQAHLSLFFPPFAPICSSRHSGRGRSKRKQGGRRAKEDPPAVMKNGIGNGENLPLIKCLHLSEKHCNVAMQRRTWME